MSMTRQKITGIVENRAKVSISSSGQFVTAVVVNSSNVLSKAGKPYENVDDQYRQERTVNAQFLNEDGQWAKIERIPIPSEFNGELSSGFLKEGKTAIVLWFSSNNPSKFVPVGMGAYKEAFLQSRDEVGKVTTNLPPPVEHKTALKATPV